jgi:NitT/TauT family transport system substrate-binding protein
MSQKPSQQSSRPDNRRRSLLRLAGTTAIAAPALILGRQAWSAPRKLTFAWNQNSFCLTPIVVAQEKASSKRTACRWI